MATAALMAEAQAVSESKDTTTFNETYAVTGLVDPDDRVKLYEALSATGLPALGDAHPALSAALCVGRNVGVFGVSTATVECSFEVPTRDSDNPLLDTTGVTRFNASTLSERASEDVNGTRMLITWSGFRSELYPGTSSATFITFSDVVETDVNRPQWSFELSRRETSIITLANLSAAHVGHVNSTSWGTAFPIAPRSALCLAIDVEVVNDGEVRAVYQFGYNPKTYDYVATARIDNRIPENAAPGNGIETFLIYPESDFNLLPVVLA